MKKIDIQSATPPVPCILAAVLPAALVSRSGRQRLKNSAQSKKRLPRIPFPN